MKELFQQQDDDFDNTLLIKWGGSCFECCEYEDIEEDMRMHISKIRQETLQAVRGEIADKRDNYRENDMFQNDGSPEYRAFSQGYNQALDDLLKELETEDVNKCQICSDVIHFPNLHCPKNH